MEQMELRHLNVIVEGLESLAGIEREHPALGKQLLKFVTEIRDSCADGYGRLSSALSSVRSLSPHPRPDEIAEVQKQIDDAPNSAWFRDVAGICNRLAVLAAQFRPQLSEQIEYTGSSASRHAAHYRIVPLVTLLEREERDLKDDIRRVVREMQVKIANSKGNGDFGDAKAYALTVQEEIDASIDEISKLTYQIQASGSNGLSSLLTPDQIAERALQRPEIMLVISMFFVIVVFAIGAFALSYLKFYQFILLTGFTLTAVIVVNAFYLRTIDALSEEKFLKLMELALLKFFAPLTRRRNND